MELHPEINHLLVGFGQVRLYLLSYYLCWPVASWRSQQFRPDYPTCLSVRRLAAPPLDHMCTRGTQVRPVRAQRWALPQRQEGH